MAYKHKEDARRWYQDHKDEEKRKAAINRAAYQARNIAYVNKNKAAAQCADCGLKPEVLEVLDFDHIADNKDENVCVLARRPVSLKKLQEEINKCEIVCSNCHRVRTYRRRGIA